ncbi:MAG: HIT domain-containing protein [SAR324 cluster bacterium]|nr:HIT domain-containing protein [SAR324 cluster bacterium]
MSDNCIFCKIAAKGIPAKVIFEDDDLLAFLDLEPQAPFHALVIPKKHIVNLDDASEADGVLLGKILLKCAAIAKEQGLEGYRVVTNNNEIAGQSVFHIHFHILGGRRMTWPPG